MTATAKIIDLDPAQRLRRQTAEAMQDCTVEQIMELLKSYAQISYTQGYADGEKAAYEKIDEMLLDGTEPTPPSAA